MIENLIRICVADSAEQPRIGERALQSVVFGGQGGAELIERGREDVNASGVEPGQPSLSHHQMKRGPLSATGLGERECAGIKMEGRQRALSIGSFLLLAPMQPAGNHQMED